MSDDGAQTRIRKNLRKFF